MPPLTSKNNINTKNIEINCKLKSNKLCIKIVINIILYGNLLAPGFLLGDVNCIKRKGFRAGDILELSVKVERLADGSVKFSYPKDVVCHGRIANAEETLFVLQATKSPQEIWAFLNNSLND